MADKGKAALTGAASGAAAGAVLGPWGAAAGGVIGGALGYFGAGDDEKAPTYTPSGQNFQYGLGPSNTYASQQSASYDRKQAELAALGADAYNRDAPIQGMPDRISHVGSQGQNYLQGADAAGRKEQLTALGGLQGQVGRLNRFADAPMGPSAAQAQLRAGTDMAAKQQFGFARAQPGGGGAALRGAAMNAAGISGNAANTSATLLAQETAQHRNQQLQALGAAQQGAGQVAGYSGQLRGQDQGFAQAQAGQANFDAGAVNQFNQGQQQLQFNVGQNNLNSQLQTTRGNDATYLATQGLNQGYEGMRNNLAAGQQSATQAFEAAKLQGAGLGSANFNAAQQQSNAETGMMLGALSSGAGAVGQISSGGNQTTQPTSDVRAKKDIKPASVLEALGGGRSGQYTPEQQRQIYAQQTDPYANVRREVAGAQATRALSGLERDTSEFGQPAAAQPDPLQARLHAIAQANGGTLPSTWGTGRETDMRPAQGYEYSYRDPEQHGEGRFVGPMAQNLEHLPGVVEQGPGGEKSINAPRLTLANTAAVSEQQRRLDELERRQQLEALGFRGGALPPINTTGFDTAYQGVY